MRTSYSALTTYQQCPQKYKFQEIDRIRAPKNAEAIFGNTVHSCLKFMFEHTPLYPTLDEIINFFRNLWDNKTGIKLNPEENNAYREEGISILKNFYRLNQPWNFSVLDLESKFEVILDDSETGENHILAGKIDRIDKIADENHYEIIDYKTSRRMPSQADLDKDLQMAIYHLGLVKRWPHVQSEKIKLSLYFLKHGEKITTSRSSEDLEKTKNNVLNSIREIQNRISKNDFPAYPTVLCGWCGYKPQCPMWKHEYMKSQVPDIKSQNEIEEVIKEYFSLKEQNNQNNKRLQELQVSVYEFMNQEGVERVFSEKGYLTKAIQERLIYDMKKIKQILEELNRWNEVIQKKQFSTLKATKKKPIIH